MGTPLRVLIVEDSEEDTLLIVRELKRGGFDPIHERVETAESMKAALSTKTWDLILADYSMPHFSGLEALKLSKESGLDLPFIIVSGSIGEDVAVEAMKSGAHDYLMKNNLTRLIPAIQQELHEAEVRQKLKESEKAFQEAQRSLEAVVETAPSLIVLTDPDGRIVLFNHTCEELTGYKREEVIGKTIPELFLPPEWIPVIQKRFANPHAPEVRAPHENPWLTKSGEERLIEWRCTVLPSPQDGRPRILGTGIDITERRRREEALRKKTALLEAISSIFKEALVCETSEEVGRLCLALAQELTGSKMGFIGEVNEAGCLDTIALSDPGWEKCKVPKTDAVVMINNMEIRGIWGRVIKAGESLIVNQPSSHPDRVVVPEGHPPITAFLGVPLKQSGRTIGMVSLANKESGYSSVDQEMVENLSTAFVEALMRKRAEEALRESEDRYRDLVEHSHDLLCTHDLEGKLLSVNPAVLRIGGYSKDELLGMNFGDFLAPEVRGQFGNYLTEIQAKGAASGVMLVQTKGGEKRLWEYYNTLRTEGIATPIVRGMARDITEHKNAEKALQDSENRYRTLVENSNDGIALVKGDIHLYVNQKFLEIFGYNHIEEIVEKPISITIHPDDRDRVVEMVRGRQTKEEEPSKYEFKGIRKDGSIVYIEVAATKTTYQGEAVSLSYHRDITERKRTEEALRSSEEKYRTILENIEDGYFEVDIAGNFTFYNDSLCRILGYSRDEIIGMNNRQYTDQENAKKLFQAFNKVYRTGEPDREFDWEIIRKDGTRRSIEASVSLLKDPSGNRIGFRGIVGDITDRKQAEEALRKSEEKFQELFDGAPVGYHEVDREGRIIQVNRTELTMLGYTVEEMLGQPVWKFIVEEESQKALMTKITGVVPPGRQFERTYRRKDGTVLPVLIEDRLLRDTEGRISGIRSTIQDITERKRAEEEKATLQEQLRQSQKIEAIGRLAGGIAHDFNNLLTVIKGYSQLSLIEIKEDVPLRGNIEEIKRASDKAADLTRQLLAFSRRQILEMRVLDLNTVLRDMDKMLHRLIGEDIELVTVFTDDLGRVKTDPGWVEQIIMNLAVNARDAMPSVGKLTIETANVELDGAYARNHIAVTPGRYVMLSMSDTGVGMTPEVRQQVFEPFFTTKEKGKGTPIKRHLSREKSSPQARRSVFFEEKMRLREWALL